MKKKDQSDLIRCRENGPGYIFLQSPDQQEEIAIYFKARETESMKSVHFYFPNELDAVTLTTNHMASILRDFPKE